MINKQISPNLLEIKIDDLLNYINTSNDTVTSEIIKCIIYYYFSELDYNDLKNNKNNKKFVPINSNWISLFRNNYNYDIIKNIIENNKIDINNYMSNIHLFKNFKFNKIKSIPKCEELSIKYMNKEYKYYNEYELINTDTFNVMINCFKKENNWFNENLNVKNLNENYIYIEYNDNMIEIINLQNNKDKYLIIGQNSINALLKDLSNLRLKTNKEKKKQKEERKNLEKESQEKEIKEKEKNEIEEIKLDNSKKNEKNILPDFKNEKIIIKDYLYYKTEKNYNSIYKSCYDIYNMKSNQNFIYIAYINYNRELAIFRYDIFNMEYKIMHTFKIEKIKKSYGRNQISQIKYFYNPLTDKEYLFTFYGTKLLIYLIKDEKNYMLIKKHKQKDILGCAHPEETKLPIYYFKIFHNTYLKKNLLIISYIYQAGRSNTNRFEFYEFNDENDLLLIKDLYFRRVSFRKFSMIYEDKNLSKYDFIFCNDSSVKLLNTNNLMEKEIDLFNKINIKEKELSYEFGCIINKNNKDYLCLGNKYYNNIILYDLSNKIIITNILLNIEIHSMAKYNDDYLIISNLDSIYLFDLKKSQIVGGKEKYKMLIEQDIINEIISVKTYETQYKNFIFADNLGEIILFG